MSERGRGLIHEVQSEIKEWYTPNSIFANLPIHFNLDVCSPTPEFAAGVPYDTRPERLTAPPGVFAPYEYTPCDRHLSVLDDGLTHPWHGTVWCNPPYGADIPAWADRLTGHDDGMMLVFVRTDTAWFHLCKPDATLFVQSRVRFRNALTGTEYVWSEKHQEYRKGSPGAPSMLLAWGDKCVRALENATLRGTVLYPSPAPLPAGAVASGVAK